VEIVRRFSSPVEDDGFQAPDTHGAVEQVERMVAEGLIDPELEWNPLIVGDAEGHGYRGHDGLRDGRAT
jgi:hypothetical protein